MKTKFKMTPELAKWDAEVSKRLNNFSKSNERFVGWTKKELESIWEIDMEQTKWGKCPKAEAVLSQLNIKWQVETIHLKDINWTQTEANCGRLGKLVSEQTVDDYAEQMRRGDKFPMPIASKTPGGIVIPAGVHRVKAAERNGQKTISAYIADIKLPNIYRLVAVMTNRLEGVRVSKEDAIEYGVHLVIDGEMTTKDVCELLGIAAKQLSEEYRAIRQVLDHIFAGPSDGVLPSKIVQYLASKGGLGSTLDAVSIAVSGHVPPEKAYRRYMAYLRWCGRSQDRSTTLCVERGKKMVISAALRNLLREGKVVKVGGLWKCQ